MKVKVVKGVHVEPPTDDYPEGQCYVTGDVLESDTDLAAMFECKFLPVSDDTPVSQPKTSEQVREGMAALAALKEAAAY